MSDPRSSSALFKRAEQLKRWEESDTNKQSSTPKRPTRIRFSAGIVFLASCTAGDKEEVERLLKAGTDINTANVDGLTALHQACIDDNLDMVEFLVSHGADVNRGDNEGWTPLHATASCGFISIARYLLENGADVAAVNYDGELPVDIAENHEAMIELLQKVIEEKGVDCHKSRNAEVYALMNDAENWAVNGYVEVRDLKTGGTPLHVAAAKGYIEVAAILLEGCCVDPDSVDYEGWTPLHAAALWGQKDTATLLLTYGADPNVKNYSGQTCMDLVDPGMSMWLADTMLKGSLRIKNKNKKKRKCIMPQNDVKHVELPNTSQMDHLVNDKPVEAPELNTKVAEGKPPKGRAPPENTEMTDTQPPTDAGPSWRWPASIRKLADSNRDNKSTNNTGNDTMLRRTHSFENDKTFYQRYRDVTARIKASSCPSIPPVTRSSVVAAGLRRKSLAATNKASVNTNEDIKIRIRPSERREKDTNARNATANTSANSTRTNTTTQTTVRSSTESVESNSSSSNPTSVTPTKLSPGNIFKNFFKSFVPPVRDEESETRRKAHAKRVRETRRSTQGVTFDEIKSAEQLVKKKTGNGTADLSAAVKNVDDLQPINTESGLFELEDAGRVTTRLSGAGPTSTNTVTETTVTLPLRRPVSATTVNTNTTLNKEENHNDEKEKDLETSTESKSSSNVSPASTQAALNVIQRRRRPKRRSTGVGHVDMDDIINDRCGGGEGDGDIDNGQSGTERTEDCEEKDYKALYEASQVEVRRLRALLTTSEQQLQEASASIARLSQVNQNSLSEIDKREKRAMERKLSEMEEELKSHQTLQAENQRLKDENGALIRVISKLSK